MRGYGPSGQTHLLSSRLSSAPRAGSTETPVLNVLPPQRQCSSINLGRSRQSSPPPPTNAAAAQGQASSISQVSLSPQASQESLSIPRYSTGPSSLKLRSSASQHRGVLGTGSRAGGSISVRVGMNGALSGPRASNSSTATSPRSTFGPQAGSTRLTLGGSADVTPSRSSENFQWSEPREEVAANASTCASDSTSVPLQESQASSSRVLFAKASELIRVEIAASERRIGARFEQERLLRDAAIAKMQEDMDSMVSIVEALAQQPPQNSPLSTLRQSPSAANDSMRSSATDDLAVRKIEGERRACGALLKKFEVLASQMQCLTSGPDEGLTNRMNDAMDRERQSRCYAIESLQKQIHDLSDDVSSLPSAQLEGATCWNKLNVLLENERLARDTICCQLRKDVDGLSSTSRGPCTKPEIDEFYLNSMFEQERRKRDFALSATCTSMRKEFCREMEAMALGKMESPAVAAPDEERIAVWMEQLQTGMHDSCATLQQNIDSLAFEVRSSPKVPSANPALSPLEARLGSTAHLAFGAAGLESTTKLDFGTAAVFHNSTPGIQDSPEPPGNEAFGAVFEHSPRA